MQQVVVVFVAILWVQNTEPVTCLEPSSTNFLNDDPNGIYNDELQLFQRSTVKQKNVALIPELDTHKVKASFEKFPEETLENTKSTLSKLSANFGSDSLVSQLFGLIQFAMRRPEPKTFAGEAKPQTYSFTKELTEQTLLTEVETLPEKSITNSRQQLLQLIKQYKDTEVGVLFNSIAELLNMQPILQKFGKLCKNVDQTLGLDKPLDLATVSLPVPTDAKPVVYFELVDKKVPKSKCLVRVKKDGDAIAMIVLIEPEGNKENRDWYTYTAENNQKAIQEMYKNLPISKIVQR